MYMEVIPIKKLSEVCKLVGVTRRTLQEYDRIDLLKPSDKTEGGYWLYEDEAVQKLIGIQIFIEAGYKRNEIKSIMELPQLDILEEYEKIIGVLTQKRKQLDGMINTIRTLQTLTRVPEESLRAISKIDFTKIYEQKNFKDCLKESVSNASDYKEEDIEEANLFMPFWYQLIAIGCLAEEKSDSKNVQQCVKNYYTYIVDNLLDEEDIEDCTEKEIAETMQKITQEMLADGEIQEFLKSQCGNNSVKFIFEALQVFTAKAADKKLGKGGTDIGKLQ